MTLEELEVEFRVRKEAREVLVEVEKRAGAIVEGARRALDKVRQRAQLLDERRELLQGARRCVLHVA